MFREAAFNFLVSAATATTLISDHDSGIPITDQSVLIPPVVPIRRSGSVVLAAYLPTWSPTSTKGRERFPRKPDADPRDPNNEHSRSPVKDEWRRQPHRGRLKVQGSY